MILVIFIVSLFAISAVSAEDNVTTDDENYNARIIAKDINQEYDPINGNTVLFNIVDMGGKAIDDAEPIVKYDDRRAKVVYDDDHYFSKKQGTYYLDKDAEIGNHNVMITLDTPNYSAKPVFINVKITKMASKMSLKKYVTTNNQYAVMKQP